MNPGLRPKWAAKAGQLLGYQDTLEVLFNSIDPPKEHATRKTRKQASSRQLSAVTSFSGQLRWGHAQSSPLHLLPFNSVAQWFFVHKVGFLYSPYPSETRPFKIEVESYHPLCSEPSCGSCSLGRKAKALRVTCEAHITSLMSPPTPLLSSLNPWLCPRSDLSLGTTKPSPIYLRYQLPRLL